MDVVEAIKFRKSIRGYKADPVPKEILSEILEIATHSPSAENTQPWEFTIIAGEALEEIKRANVEMLEAGVPPNPDVPTRQRTGIYRERQVELAVQIFEALGISREDKAKRMEWRKKGYQYFNAPAAIIISVDDSIAEMGTVFDIGIITQTITLAALNYGLGTCIHYQVVSFPDILRS